MLNLARYRPGTLPALSDLMRVAEAVLIASFLDGSSTIEYTRPGGKPDDAYYIRQVSIARPLDEAPFAVERHRSFKTKRTDPWPTWRVIRGSGCGPHGFYGLWLPGIESLLADCRLVALAVADRVPAVRWVTAKAGVLRQIVCRFSDDDSGHTFSGYTDGRHWNGFECPHLPLAEFRHVLDVLLEWGDEQHYDVIDDQHVRVHGKAGIADTYVMTAKLAATTAGDLWLFDCGGAWTFVEVLSKDEEET